MSVHAVARVKQVMELYVNQALSPLVVNTEAAERVVGWLEDAASRESYQRELAFMALRGLIRDDYTTLQYAGSITIDEWNKTLARVAELRESGSLPDLDYPQPPSAASEWVQPWMYASNYVLGQYAYGDQVTPRGVYLDCGACCGETAVWALGAGAGTVFAFEPNPEAFGYLERNAKKFGADGRIVPVPRALGDVPQILSMQTEEGNIGGARLASSPDNAASAGEAISVPVVTLDGWCRENNVRPDSIKMDLEGWEMAALRGARNVIAQHRPSLAICLYHNLSDMWTIPHLIKEICPQYRFWCKKNAPFVEFVLYASV